MSLDQITYPHCVPFKSSADGMWKQMSTTYHRRPLKRKTVTMAEAWKAPGTDCGVSPQDKLPHYKKGMLILSWLPFTLQNNHLVGICAEACNAQVLCFWKSYVLVCVPHFLHVWNGSNLKKCWVLSLHASGKWALTNCSAQIFLFSRAWLQTIDNISIFILKSLLYAMRYKVLQKTSS